MKLDFRITGLPQGNFLDQILGYLLKDPLFLIWSVLLTELQKKLCNEREVMYNSRTMDRDGNWGSQKLKEVSLVVLLISSRIVTECGKVRFTWGHVREEKRIFWFSNQSFKLLFSYLVHFTCSICSFIFFP